MKNFLKTFIHQPKKVAFVSLVLALVIGIFGYVKIHRIPEGTFKGDNGTATIKNFPLNFSVSGKVENILIRTGEKVKMGQVLATLDPDNKDGSLIQAEAAYATAKANYQKVISGATGAAIDVAKAVVNTAEVNLQEATKQQEVLVDNAYRTFLNSSLQVQTVSNYTGYDAPVVSGTYTCDKEGSYDIKTYSSSGGVSVNYSGLEKGSLLVTDIPRPMGSCGLFLSFDKTKSLLSGVEFNIQIPNTNAANYNLNNNAYQLALQNKDQAIAGAQAALEY